MEGPLNPDNRGVLFLQQAFKQVFVNGRCDCKPTHLIDISFERHIHNNKMERMNGEIRDRGKIMRALKRPDTPILRGLRIYHNFLRPHGALGGQTSPERAGIKVEEENKWLTLIQNAKRGSTDA